ncbi:MAG: aminoacyl-tRNA hydrolase [Clostridium sp.]|uniref:aminoacyl-tRNA hydrolase n=1 Tax=Clostridium sp. TaxID=1506 RepID=UPI0025C389EE|nr:aminoacyl-tRNA hydrolase [Clostridium sp.]MCH3965616.1 aminoacyl-tRNA hydrolase [Clostridium sp.]MCI1717125.1 aminoacyl-tRNA hydrolase [Clostridium sp.]MCI1801470.1 aminoacyl-tRNA hydrolase [Clostridium sp.]MCI1815311.1 aminoacyl-tRNA hydrolase [Clostridium sp.]MCI1872219.1 aminoacyl-tRNA hydrolase [Clostridium sp.]
MFLIVGLGNIGTKYEHTRHNVGFDAADFIGRKHNININKQKFKGFYGDGIICDKKVILLKPSTYMNLSGESVKEAAAFYKIDNKNIVVIQDDISLPIGRIRIRSKGSAGGHNGIKNIIYNLNTDEFVRIKIGVGHPDKDVISYVLGKFEKENSNHIEKVFKFASDCVECILSKGIFEAMNRFNGLNI